MKLHSKNLYLFTLGFFLIARGSWAASHALDLVSLGDSTYAQLGQLEDAGLLEAQDMTAPLTRLEVAKRIWKAEKKYKEIVLAQSDMELPPPPPEENGAPAPGGTEAGMAAAGEQATPTPAPAIWNNPQKIAEAEKALKSLQQAYDFELGLVRDQKSSVEDQVSKAEADQFDLWKSLKGITQYPSISIHGVGRAFGISQQYYGSNLLFPNPATRNEFLYLDLRPTGSVSKEIRWDAIFRLATGALPSPSNNGFIARRVTAEFNPDFMSATVGDFYEAYTPLTLWNRNNLDLFYKPEMVARGDDYRKYEQFFNQEPAWPFRGLRLGTAIGWPDSALFEQFKVSVFAHMNWNGWQNAGWFVGPINGANTYTNWVFAGQSGLKLRKWYLGDLSLQLSGDAYGVVLDEPLDTTDPVKATYNQFNPKTWAHQYLIGSLHPTIKIGFGGDVYAGVEHEGAFSSYQDDKTNNQSIISDYAVMVGAFFQAGDSRITFKVMDVGPYYYSPLAQIRQDDIASSGNSYVPSAGLFTPPVRNQFFVPTLTSGGSPNATRPSGIFDFYDRTQDNTFPYGLATPNRKGVGMDLDIEALTGKALKIRGAAYLVQEISGNLVVNASGTGYTGLDMLSNGTIPVRNFTYVNMGPSFDLGPVVGLETPLELGVNVRYEQTTSAIGTLNSSWILGGLKVGLFPWMETTAALSFQNFSGMETGYFYNGVPTLWARYSYVLDNTDLGKYFLFNINNGNAQSLKLSGNFKVNRNSNLYVDYDLTSGNIVPYTPISGTLNNQFMGVTYAIEF